MIFKSRRYIKSVLLSILRQYFATHAKFPYQNNALKTKIFIDEQFTQSPRKYPSIIITDSSSTEFFKTSIDRGFQESVMEERVVDNISRQFEVGNRFGMPLDTTIKIDIYHVNPFEAETIADDLSSFFIFAGYHLLRKASIELKSANAPEPSTDVIGNDLVTTYSISLSIYTEWEQVITTEESDLINSIVIPDIDGLITTEPDGTTNSVF